jgi:N-acetylglucosamine kinase-like BadF-type ATPase
MNLYLAIDAGGTKTVCCIANGERELARVSCGTVKLMRVSEAEATERLVGLVNDAAATAGVDLKKVTRTCVGIAGLSIPEVRSWAQKTLSRAVGGELLLCGDELIALDAAFPGRAGMLVMAGTGMNVVGRAADGTTYSAGGWGPALGDEGSGYWIGQEGAKAALWGLDRGIEGKLLGAIQEAWNVDTVGDMVAVGNLRPGPDFAALAPVVAWCAEEGDELAQAVLTRAGEELAEQVQLVRLKMEESGEAGTVGVAYTGSVLERIAAVRESMIRALAESEVQVKVRAEAVDSLEGALWRARGGVRC